MKNTFLEIEKINTLKRHIDKLVGKEISGGKASGSLEVDISYKDVDGNECFKSLPFDFDLELADLSISDIVLKNVSVYVVEGRGISVDYYLTVLYNLEEAKEVEIIHLEEEPVPVIQPAAEETEEEPSKEEDRPKPAEESDAQEEKEAEIEKIKEDISKDYENKLADNLGQRENKVAVITTKSSASDLNFLRFFDDTVGNYYSIKTLACGSEEMLNTISKEYKIPLDTLLKGYDREHGKVTFKLNK